MSNISLRYDQLREEWRARNYPWYSRPYDLNLFGIRRAQPRPDHFDDTLGLAWRDDSDNLYTFQVPGTTDPGAYYLGRRMGNPRGTAILMPGHYPRMYAPGRHRGKYRALVQVNPCTVGRDRNQDGLLDFTGIKTETGMFGINFHRALAQGTTNRVGPHSSGCQVVKTAHDLSYFLEVVDLQIKWIKFQFVSYTLLYEPELLFPEYEEGLLP